MEQKVISKTEEQSISLIKEANLDFYLIMPNNKEVNILLGIFPNINDDVVKTLPKEKDKVIVIPVINEQILTNANHLDATSVKYLDNVLSFLINATYKILTYNKLQVNNKILLNNHASYDNFNKKFIEKYQGRVELYDLMPKTINKPTPNGNIFEPVEQPKDEFKPVQPPFQNQTPTNNKIDTLEEDIEPILYDEPVITSSDMKGTHEPGFVSYVLLGVLVAVVSLVFLYFIL